MSALQTALAEYLAVRRALGFKLHNTGATLHQFVQFAEREGAVCITTELALRWATHPVEVHPAHWATRLSMVRRFAQYCRGTAPHTEIPPQGLLPYRYHRKPPYMYTEQEISQLLAAAHQLQSLTGLRANTYATVLGLLAVTGMRLSEAVGLERADVDLADGSLTIRHTKFGKTRWLPLHPSTQYVLGQYAGLRDHLWPRPHTPRFFLSERGTRLTSWSVRQTFVQLSRHIGLRGATARHGPRLHDLRHSFAVRTLLTWYGAGIHVEQRLPTLAAYLGHAHVNDTYWYLSATPELLRLATQRLTTDLEGTNHVS